MEEIEVFEELSDAFLPDRLVWWHRNQYPPIWLHKEYELNDLVMYPRELHHVSSLRFAEDEM